MGTYQDKTIDEKIMNPNSIEVLFGNDDILVSVLWGRESAWLDAEQVAELIAELQGWLDRREQRAAESC